MVKALPVESVAAEFDQSATVAVADADVISCATLARETVLKGAWLTPGKHVGLIGSFTPGIRNTDQFP